MEYFDIFKENIILYLYKNLHRILKLYAFFLLGNQNVSIHLTLGSFCWNLLYKFTKNIPFSKQNS